MKPLFENWRKYINESNEPDHLSDEAELTVHPDADVDKEKLSPSKGSLYLSQKAKSEIHSYLKAWFNQAATIYRNDPDFGPVLAGPEPDNPYKVKQLVRDLRKGAARQSQRPYSADVDFNWMLKKHIKPEDQEAAAKFLGLLADKVEQKSISLDPKYFFNELDGLFHVAWLQATAGDT